MLCNSTLKCEGKMVEDDVCSVKIGKKIPKTPRTVSEAGSDKTPGRWPAHSYAVVAGLLQGGGIWKKAIVTIFLSAVTEHDVVEREKEISI